MSKDAKHSRESGKRATSASKGRAVTPDENKRRGPTSSPAAPAANASQPAIHPVGYYDSNGRGFYTQSEDGNWISVAESSIKRLLRWQVYDEEKDPDIRNELIQRHMIKLQFKENVSYAGALAGYPRGLMKVGDKRFLITSGPRIIAARKGPFPLLLKFFCELLGNNQHLLFGWLKSSLESLRAGPPFRPGQMFALAGPGGCGKSLLQDLLTEIFGGRFAKPYEWLIGEDRWNDDILKAEHLMIEDDADATDYRSRRNFGFKIKGLVANQTQMLKQRFADNVPVRTFGRVSMTMNEEAENLMVMPIIDESLTDKIIFARASMATFPYDKNDLDGRAEYRENLSKEMPAFIAFLDAYVIPEQMQDQRYGIKGYQDPSLMLDLTELTPEEELLSLIDHLNIWEINSLKWTGTATKLQSVLLEKDRTGRIKSILTFSTACGVFLERLKRSHADRITEDRNGGKTREWTIHKSV